MAVEHLETARVRVVWQTASGYFDLRFYDADVYIVSVWWLGISDSIGDLQSTDVLDGTKSSLDDLYAWLISIVGQDVAGQLVRQVVESKSGVKQAP